MGQVEQQQEHQPEQQHTRQQSAAHGDENADEGLPHQHLGDMPLFHAENVIKSQLLFAPLDEKAVGVKQKDQGEQTDDGDAEAQDEGGGLSARVGGVQGDGR